MHKRLGRWIVAALISASVSPPVSAHHSYMYTAFDQCQSTSIEGEIERVSWKAPHVWFTVRTGDSTVYEVEWVGLGNLINQGIEAADLPVGDHVVVTGSKHPSSNVISLLTEVRVIEDEFHWSRTFPVPVYPQKRCSAL